MKRVWGSKKKGGEFLD